MSAKQYDQAINSYSQAIALDSTNPVYYSNRAAAHSSKGDHLSAVGDAEKAITVDPSFVKAYHRLGYVPFLSVDAVDIHTNVVKTCSILHRRLQSRCICFQARPRKGPSES